MPEQCLIWSYSRLEADVMVTTQLPHHETSVPGIYSRRSFAWMEIRRTNGFEEEALIPKKSGEELSKGASWVLVRVAA